MSVRSSGPRRAIGLAAGTWWAVVAALAAASAPPGESAWTALAVYPPRVELDHAGARHRVLAVATRSDGVTREVTAEAEWEFSGAESAALIAVGEGRAVVPRADGACVLTVRFEGLTARCAVAVHGAATESPASFCHDVAPILTRAGCNAGGCHGASSGKDGFRLSLFGFDLQADYQRLTRERSTRRINRADPDESLLLRKAAGQVPHTGGKRLEADAEHFARLRDWIARGAPNDLDGAATVERLEIFPPRAVLEDRARQQFLAVAHYSDGRQRDVTDLAIFLSNNAASAAASPAGLVESGARGEAFVTARFDTRTVGSPVLALPGDARYVPPAESPANYVDELVEAKLRTLRAEPSPLCSDEEFLRRASIDAAGRLPTAAEHAAFMADADPHKRARKIDELLESKEFAEIWAMKLAELLLVRTEPNRVEYKPMFLYWQWLQQQVADGVPLDVLVRRLLTASGGSFAEPAVNFYQIEPMPEKIAENAAQALLGIRIQCAQCHNHPFDRWTMDDYYGFAAFFAQIGRKPAEDYRETIVFNRGIGDAVHPVGGRVMAPKFLGGVVPDVQHRDRRAALAEWIAAPENPYFAANLANRAWAHFMGVGVVEPVDDLRISNPPSNPELFAELGRRLAAYEFDLRRLVRDIVNSHAYQRSSAPTPGNAHDRRNFARAAIRRIPAEVLLDCLCQATGVPDKFPGLPLGARAVQLADGAAGNYFLQTFGRARRTTVCACEVQTDPTLSQALHLLNGPTVHDKIRQGRLIETELAAGKTPGDVIQTLYVRCLSRAPDAQELPALLALCGSQEQPVAELHDIFWAVLNSREFLFNH